MQRAIDTQALTLLRFGRVLHCCSLSDWVALRPRIMHCYRSSTSLIHMPTDADCVEQISIGKSTDFRKYDFLRKSPVLGLGAKEINTVTGLSQRSFQSLTKLGLNRVDGRVENARGSSSFRHAIIVTLSIISCCCSPPDELME